MAEHTIIVAYVPVLHAGYLQFFDKYPNARIYLLFDDALSGFDWLKRDMRAVDVLMIMAGLKFNYKDKREIFLANYLMLRMLSVNYYPMHTTFVMPDEDISHELTRKYFSRFNVVFDSIFLRWDKNKTLANQPINNDRTIPVCELDKELLRVCETLSLKSSDWWRQIGALIVGPIGEVLLTAWNKHVPHPQMPYINGDPRSNFTYGINIELGTAHHAEKVLICEAARKGISIEGTYLYTTAFPCPPCAKDIAACGIKRIYYKTGYAMVDGESILKSSGVEIVQVTE